MKINPNLYDGERKIIIKPQDMTMARYIGDLTNLIPGKTYTFSCKMKQIPGIDKRATNIIHIAQGHNQRYKSYGGYYIKDISDGILEFTFNYIAEANSILCYTNLSSETNNIGAAWWDIEIVEGASKNPLYVPNKDSLEPSKQAIFVAGGVFKEVYSD